MKKWIYESKTITGGWHFGRWLACPILLLVMALAAPAIAAPPAGPSGTCGGSGTIICIDPATQSIGQNQATTVDIRVDNVTNLYGADVILSFSPSILCGKDGGHACPNSAQVQLTPGPLLTSNGAGSYFTLFNYADNSTGTIEFTIIQFNPAPPVTGSGVLATLTFVGLAGPQSPIHFTYAKLSDRNGIQIPATTLDGVINVSAPTAVSLSSFEAREQEADENEIGLKWTTASEIKTAGFNVYRSEQPQGPYRRMNRFLIPAAGSALLGNTYTFLDFAVEPGKEYYYQLEDVELDGASTRHETFAAASRSSNRILELAFGGIGSAIALALISRRTYRRFRRRM